MNLNGKYLIVWILDDAAKLFLGLTAERAASRWAIRGKCETGDARWLWITIDEVDERRPPRGRTVMHKHWKVTPRLCSINWDWIITIQVAGDSPLEAKEIGFKVQNARA